MLANQQTKNSDDCRLRRQMSCDVRVVDQRFSDKLDQQQWKEEMAKQLSQEDLNRWVDQIYADVRQQLRDRSEWAVLTKF